MEPRKKNNRLKGPVKWPTPTLRVGQPVQSVCSGSPEKSGGFPTAGDRFAVQGHAAHPSGSQVTQQQTNNRGEIKVNIRSIYKQII